MYFLESSALVKLFVAEQGSHEMIELVERLHDNEKFASALAFLEVRSAIRRRQKAGELQHSDVDRALEALASESRRLVEHPLTAPVLQTASALLDRQQLRALDALQLATAILVRENSVLASSLLFVCADERLIEAATAEGFQIWNPSAEPL